MDKNKKETMSSLTEEQLIEIAQTEGLVGVTVDEKEVPKQHLDNLQKNLDTFRRAVVEPENERIAKLGPKPEPEQLGQPRQRPTSNSNFEKPKKPTPVKPIQPSPAVYQHDFSDWGMINMAELPSRGRGYYMGTQLWVRSANNGECSNWGTMDVDKSAVELSGGLDMICQSCVRVESAIGEGFEAINDIDKLYLAFRIYERTFPNRENVISLPFRHVIKTHCQYDDQEHEIQSNMLNYWTEPKELKDFYVPEDRCYRLVWNKQTFESIDIYLPTIGTSQIVKNAVMYIKEYQLQIPREHIGLIPFLIPNADDFSDPTTFKDAIVEMTNIINTWDKRKLSKAINASKLISEAIGGQIRMKKTCAHCGGELDSPLFQVGRFLPSNFFVIRD